MQKFVKRFPILAAFLLPLVVFFVVDLAAALLAYPLYSLCEPRLADYLLGDITYLIGIPLCLLLLYKAGLWNELGYRREGLGMGLLCGGLLIVTSVYDFVNYIWYLDPATFRLPSPGLFMACVVNVLLIGLCEELIFRGGVLNLLLLRWGGTKKGITRAVVLSSVLFGAVHITNWLNYPQLFWTTLSHMVYATFFGVLIAAAYLRSRNLWAVSLLHAIFDASLVLSIFSEQAAALEYTDISPLAAVNGVLTSLPYLILGMLVLEGVRPRTTAPPPYPVD